MTAFKRYIRSKGYKTEEDYPCIPYQPLRSNIVILGIYADAEKACLITEHNIGTSFYYFGRDGEVEWTDFD